MVRPAHDQQTSCTKPRQFLSPLDQINSLTHTQIIYFYQPPKILCTPRDTIFVTLRDSLSRVLVPFYPLAGRLRWSVDHDQTDNHNGRLELDCNGHGVAFFEAELDAELVEFGDFTPSSTMNYRCLFSCIDYNVPIHEMPVLFLQLTKFKCGGMSLSMSFSHIVADGVSMAHFLMEWARVSRGEPIQTMPCHDRNVSIIMRTSQVFDHSVDFLHLPRLLIERPKADDHREVEKMMKRTVISLRLTKYQVGKLQKNANHDCQIDEQNHVAYTRYEAVAAHIWRCMSKVRKNKDEQATTNIITVDARCRLEPALPEGYFGNAIFDVKATIYAGDLVAKPLGYEASRIRAAIEKVTNEYVLSAIHFIKNQQDLSRLRQLYSFFVENKIFLGNPNVAVTNWVNLPAYGLDFGWGKEIYFGPGDLETDGDSVVLRDCSGDIGSLIVVLCLQVDHVDDFKMHFYKEILSSSL
ncbi:hypothetical protein TIFTF001_021164 [Ficus carica]|uniref:Uncharacterized protein n=1 Tax=Ficus carica TaxID=3494 RepID=A0AA88AS99_FICCA|nr:hypothetical protein TIFTF001_021164 [Ficus carica]